MNDHFSDVKPKPQLSLLAQFDDLCRFSNYIISSNEELGVIRELVDNQEENRLIWLSNKEGFKKLKDENEKLKSTLNEMQINLIKSDEKNVNLQSLSRQLKHKLDSIKSFIENNIKFCRCDPIKDQLLSYFDQNVIKEEDMDLLNKDFLSSDDNSLFQETYEVFPDSARAIDTMNRPELNLLFDCMDLID